MINIEFTEILNEIKNIDLLIQENGLFIGHTYFSVNMKHHYGKLFENENILNSKVVENFKLEHVLVKFTALKKREHIFKRA